MKFIKLLNLRAFVHASNITAWELAEIREFVHGLSGSLLLLNLLTATIYRGDIR